MKGGSIWKLVFVFFALTSFIACHKQISNLMTDNGEVQISCELTDIAVKNDSSTFVYGKVALSNMTGSSTGIYHLKQFHLALPHDTSSSIYIDSYASVLIHEDTIRGDSVVEKDVYWVFDHKLSWEDLNEAGIIAVPLPTVRYPVP